jgi:hypothetical protein
VKPKTEQHARAAFNGKCIYTKVHTSL